MDKRRKQYLRYLNSDKWAKTRRRALERAGFRCAKCQRSKRLHVHHLTYARFGNENDEDLQVLCERCHRALHRDRKRHRERRKRRAVGGWVR
jgi:5-methylcytosine-specific restriction endonuclease McrA